jgi:hypothetical protein
MNGKVPVALVQQSAKVCNGLAARHILYAALFELKALRDARTYGFAECFLKGESRSEMHGFGAMKSTAILLLGGSENALHKSLAVLLNGVSYTRHVHKV